MNEESQPYRSLSPSQPIAVFLDYGVFETPTIPSGVTVITETVEA
jgi:hypothetical protein